MDYKKMAILTEREREVWLLYEQGLTRKQIAKRLGITDGTVAMHIRYAERRFRKYDRSCAVVARIAETVSFQMTIEEIKIIIQALHEYEHCCEPDTIRRVHRLLVKFQTADVMS